MQKAYTVFIVQHHIAFIHAAIQYMIKLHLLSITQSRTSDVRLWGLMQLPKTTREDSAQMKYTSGGILSLLIIF